MKVLESKETPGLGDKIEKDSTFVNEFRGVATPLDGVKEARRSGAANEIVMITGATISSQTIVDVINERLQAVGAPLERLWTEGLAAARRRPSAPPAPATTGTGGAS
jgi:Na+-translocating ferredoxin:NAD+ oxidoreductase RnfG subunit